MIDNEQPDDRRIEPPGKRLRRLLFACLVVGTTAFASVLMLDIVGASGVTVLETAILLLFVPTFGWISVPLWNAVFGFLLTVLGRDPLTLQPTVRRPSAGRSPIRSRTALVIPARHEDPARICDNVAAMVRSLEATGHAERFDVHLLSDTSGSSGAQSEEAAWTELSRRMPHPERLHYRRRAENTGRKAGNIADFCSRHGEAYDFMIVLDADSVMSGPTMVELVRTMEANPDVGLVQTAPIPIRQVTAFGRFVQFAGALYGPMLAAGQTFWQTDASNYWGHNAIVRIRPFMAHCTLPMLPGHPPLGGPVLSHDFVEAALLRRAGWRVLMMAGLAGSYEEVPSNVIEYARRDRRWAQGSLQHLRLLAERGLHSVSRVHLAFGAMGYLSSVLWLLLLVASTVYVLFPAASKGMLLDDVGPITGLTFSGEPLLPLLAFTAVVLFAPKGLGVLLALGRRSGGFGGSAALTLSACFEALFSVIIAPLMMMYHASFVLDVLRGRDVAWGPQARKSRHIPWSEALRQTSWIAGVGTAWGGATLYYSPAFFVWLTPIFVGLLLAAPLTRWSSSETVGRWLRLHGLLLVPSETRPPPELVRGYDEPNRIPTPERSRPRAERETARGGLAACVLQRMGKRRRRKAHERNEGSGMYDVERGVFDLRRGRPLYVKAARPDGGGGVLVASVEGLESATLGRLLTLGREPLRLVVTHRRAKAMGMATGDHAGTNGGLRGVSLALSSQTPGEIFRLAGAHRTFDLAIHAPREASPAESAALALTRLGRLLPAAVAVSVDVGGANDLRDALQRGEILQVTVAQIREAAAAPTRRIDVNWVSDAPVPLPEVEDARFVLFRESTGLLEHVAILVGERERWPDPVPVRLHSACLTGDLFGSMRCDCGEQLRGSLRVFTAEGGGVLLYLAQEGRGIGLGNKLRAYTLQHGGLDTVDADSVLGFGADERTYEAAVGMLRRLGVERVRLLTNNPAKVRALQESGIQVVDRQALHGTLNRHNLPYVHAKVHRAGHWLAEMLHEDAGPQRTGSGG